MDAYNAARCRTMEYATLLWSLQEIPEDPSEGPTLPDNPKRVLTFEREKQLADDLAFLASSSDDPNQIKAVCVEENTADEMIVKIASNSPDADMTAGFTELFSIMETVGDPGLCSSA
ncbi:hypothetical protein AMS68_003320 [Peltaster fructicola]|uniref:Uncharacterized protein n=1 Tax=Peltaster fructicola TaxID=286661 RepID=A0A6H0XSV8_9PEZI|nr:hypothetical protein AMS68_003320 [Peltaster fructicola]